MQDFHDFGLKIGIFGQKMQLPCLYFLVNHLYDFNKMQWGPEWDPGQFLDQLYKNWIFGMPKYSNFWPHKNDVKHFYMVLWAQNLYFEAFKWY